MPDKITGFQALGGSKQIKWGRDVSQAAETALTENNRLRQDFDNNASSTRTNMRVVSEQIQELEITQAELAAAQQRLEDQQEELENQNDLIIAQQAAIVAQQNYLNSLVVIQASGSSTGRNVSGGNWGTLDLPGLLVATSTGRLKVTVSGLLIPLGVSAVPVLTFSIPGYVDRAAQITAITSGTFSGLSNALASTAFINGSYSQYVTGLPANTNLPVQAEFYAHNSDGAYTNLKIIAEVVP